MSYDHPIELVENDILVVSVTDNAGSYFMWQKGLTEDVGSEDGIYFEYDDQINGGHNTVVECSLDSDGIHVVLNNGKLAHFYFHKEFDKHRELKQALENFYGKDSSVLEAII